MVGLPPNEVGGAGEPDTPSPDDPNAELPAGEPGGGDDTAGGATP